MSGVGDLTITGEYISRANNNSAFGTSTLGSITSGNKNTAIGFDSSNLITTGGDNTTVGQRAGAKITGNQNTYLGSRAGENSSSGANNIVIGFNAVLSNVTLSNRTVIGNTATLEATIHGLLNIPDGLLTQPASATENGLTVVMDNTTTARGLQISSNAASTNSRELALIHNDNVLATGTTVLKLQQDSTGFALDIIGSTRTQGAQQQVNGVYIIQYVHQESDFGVAALLEI